MRIRVPNLLAALALFPVLNLPVATAQAQGTAFTYQGRLNDGGLPASGSYDFRFRLASDPLANNYVGSAYLTNGIAVANGLFATTLDFGPGAFTGSNYWLEVDVRTNGATSYTALTPLQALTPTPYAIMANSASNLLGTLPAAQLGGALQNSSLTASPTFSGTVTANAFSGSGPGLTGLNPANLSAGTAAINITGNAATATTATSANAATTAGSATTAATANNFSGALAGDVTGTQAATMVSAVGGVTAANVAAGATAANASTSANTANTLVERDGSGSFSAGTITAGGFTGNGAGMTNVNAATLAGLGAGNFWQLGGNNVAPGQFIGSTNNQPVEIWAGGVRMLRLEPGIGGLNTPNVIGGSPANLVPGNVRGVTIGGGGTIGHSVVFPGVSLNNSATGDFDTVSGGVGNTAAAFHAFSIGEAATVSGGAFNAAEEEFATVGGGFQNTASGSGATVPGGGNNLASGNVSFAAGSYAQATNDNTFVWSDGSSGLFSSTTNDEFSIRAQNGVRIQSAKGIHLNAADEPIIVRDWDPFAANAPADKAGIGRWGLFMEPTLLTLGIPGDDVAPRYLQVAKYNTNGTPTMLMQVDQGGNVLIAGVLSQNSDRNVKKDFTPVDPQTVLAKVAALPMTEWVYKTATGARHLGPIAQDFHAAFGLNGNDDQHITTVDEGGVALAAIQGLDQKLETGRQNSDVRMRKLEAENADLKARLEKLEQLVTEKIGGAQ